MTLGNRMRSARKEKGLSMGKLSDKTGIAVNSIAGYELDRHEPSLFNICLIADALDVSIDYLAGRLDKNG